MSKRIVCDDKVLGYETGKIAKAHKVGPKDQKFAHAIQVINQRNKETGEPMYKPSVVTYSRQENELIKTVGCSATILGYAHLPLGWTNNSRSADPEKAPAKEEN